MPPPQQQFSMAAPPRQYVQQPYNLSGALNTTNLGQQQTNMPRRDVYYTQQQPNYSNPTSIAQLQAMYGTRPSGGPPPQQQQYFTPQQYRQDPYMDYVRNHQQALQQRAIQSANMQNLQQAEVLRQQQAAQQGARQRAAVQGGGNASGGNASIIDYNPGGSLG
jgi:hypothetical protein